MKATVAAAQDVLAVLLILGVLLQTPKATGLGGTLGGGTSDGGGGYRQRRGIEVGLFRFSIVAAIAFAVVSVIAGKG